MTPKLPKKTAKTMKLICKTDNFKRYFIQNGDKVKAKFCSISDETGKPVYMVINQYGNGYKMSITLIEKNCEII